MNRKHTETTSSPEMTPDGLVDEYYALYRKSRPGAGGKSKGHETAGTASILARYAFCEALADATDRSDFKFVARFLGRINHQTADRFKSEIGPAVVSALNWLSFEPVIEHPLSELIRTLKRLRNRSIRARRILSHRNRKRSV
jgi:hypothetical protein